MAQRVTSICICLLAFGTIFSSALLTVAKAEQYAETVAAVRAADPNLLRPLSNQAQKTVEEIDGYDRATYAQIRSRYRRLASLAAREFPETLSGKADLSMIKPFSGSLSLVDPEIYACPFLLISPINFQSKGSILLKQSIKVGDRYVPLLVFRSAASQSAQQSKANIMLEASLRTINARVLGFSYAQLLTPLSKNVVPAAQFDYNGLKDWSRHNRLSRDDQIQKPIALTNHAHRSGEKYLVSTHPDFSLQLNFFRQDEVRMTFFLWKERPTEIPDLIYVIEYRPQSESKVITKLF